MTGVYLAGEGPTELGGWANEPVYRSANPDVGVLQALLEKIAPDSFQIIDATIWKSIRKYQARATQAAEIRNVLGVALSASEAGADVLVFSRDRDREEARERLIEEGIKLAQETFAVKVVGGIAIEAVEAWTLALHGIRRTDESARPKDMFAAHGLSSDVRSQVEIVREADLAAAQLDAPSLALWLERARSALRPINASTAPIFLIGFMTTGKTTVGGMVAKRLGWRFLDLDQEIESRVGKTISEIFASEGEASFRQHEHLALRSASSKERTIIATGGGTAAREDNLAHMLEAGRVVALSITAEEVVRRARGGRGRPLLESSADPLEAAESLLNDREPFYARAHFQVDTVGRSPHDVAREIVNWTGLPLAKQVER